jgi:predicted transcriptional regulator
VETSLKPKQILALKLLTQGDSITDVAKELGVARSVLHQWLKNKVFVEELNLIKREGLQSARTVIQHNAVFAALSLTRIARYGKSEMARITACKEILSMSGFTKDSQEMWGWGIDFQNEPESDLDADYKSDLEQLIENMKKELA